MKGNKKYKKEILLNGNADPLMLSSLPPEKQKKCMKATYSCAFKIRNILRDFFASKGKNTFKTDCKAAFVNYFSEKASKKLGQKVITDDYLFMVSNARSKVSAIKTQLSSPPFSVPNCDFNQSVFRIAKRLHFSFEEVKTLQSALPDLLWGTSGLETSLQSLDGIREDIRGELLTAFTSWRTLVNPKEYFSANTTDEEISKNLRKHAVKLAGYVGYSQYDENKQPMEIAWYVYKYFLSFHDLTVPAINEAVYLKVSVDSRYTKLKSILLHQIAGIRHPEELSWEDAKNFLKNRIIPCEITAGKNSSHLWEDTFDVIQLLRVRGAPTMFPLHSCTIAEYWGQRGDFQIALDYIENSPL